MPYIDTVVSEKTFQYELTNILTLNGEFSERWSKLGEFTRVAYSKGESPIICCAKHFILKNPKGDYFGIAITTDVFKGPSGVSDSKIFESLGKARLGSDKRLHTFYVYMLEQFSVTDIKNSVVSTSDSPLRKALDIEYISSNKPETQQSPIVPIILRKKDSMEKFFGDDRFYSNWWEDSRIRVKGYFDENSFFFTIQADNACAWELNEVPKIPLFFGRFNTFGNDNGDNVALFGGTYGDFDEPYKALMPTSKNYYTEPGNGINNVIVRKTKYGARYQAHYLSWGTTPDLMPPSMGQYPREDDSPDDPTHDYIFNPSRYSNEVMASEAYIVHPEQGVYGTIPNIILTNQLSILEGDTMEVRAEGFICHVTSTGPIPHTHWDRFTYTELDSPSPLTIAGKPIPRTAGVGIRLNKKDY